MNPNTDNRRRAFADVVTIDAWHESFSTDCPTADLHADIVFGTARVGGEDESPVRFRLSVSRAEIVVVIPETEPVAVDRASVSRDAPEFRGRHTKVIEKKKKRNVSAQVAGKLSRQGGDGSASFGASAEAAFSTDEKVELEKAVTVMLVTQSKDADENYRWIVEGVLAPSLDGRPWDGQAKPRLKLIDKRADKSKGIPPTVRIEVRCRREDLVIEDLEIKDQSLWEEAKSKVGLVNKIIAAESYIRNRLLEEGLEVKGINDKFSHLTLGSVTAEPT